MAAGNTFCTRSLNTSGSPWLCRSRSEHALVAVSVGRAASAPLVRGISNGEEQLGQHVQPSHGPRGQETPTEQDFELLQPARGQPGQPQQTAGGQGGLNVEEQGSKTLLHGQDTSQEAQAGPPAPPTLELHLPSLLSSLSWLKGILGPLALTVVPLAVQGLCVVVPPEPQAPSAEPHLPTLEDFPEYLSLLWSSQLGPSHQPEAFAVFCTSALNLPKDSLSPLLLLSPWGRQEVSFPQEALHGSLSPQCSPCLQEASSY